MTPLPTLRQLEYVVRVAEIGQFSEAARLCAVSQPALSKQIREVEELLGVELFERSRPRTRVTPTGEAFVQQARALLAAARELVESTQGAGAGQPKSVQIGVIPTIAPYALPGLLTKLRKRYPAVTFVLHELQTEPLLEGLRNCEIDLGLLARAFEDTGLTGPDLVEEPFVLLAPRGHALAQRRVLAPEEVAGAELILMKDGHCLRDQAIDVCATAGPSARTEVAAGSITTLIRLVESGLGATLLPASALASELPRSEGIVARSFASPSPGRRVTLQWRASSSQGTWFSEIAGVLREHYLSMNATMPRISGPKPSLRDLSVSAMD